MTTVAKKVLVTGATDGIGKVTARRITERGHHVVLVGRNAGKAQETVTWIRQVVPTAEVDFLVADLSRPGDIKRLADEYQQKFSSLDVLVNNAGAFFATFEKTPDGFERTWALNHLNYFLLTDLLLSLLKKSEAGRIVNVASRAHHGAELNFDDLNNASQFNGWRAYQRSKLANILFTKELSKRLAGTTVTANALHPGFVASKFGHNNAGVWASLVKISQKIFAIDEEAGAATSVFLACDESVSRISGAYFAKCRVTTTSRQAANDESARLLWQKTEEMLAPFR